MLELFQVMLYAPVFISKVVVAVPKSLRFKECQMSGVHFAIALTMCLNAESLLLFGVLYRPALCVSHSLCSDKGCCL